MKSIIEINEFLSEKDEILAQIIDRVKIQEIESTNNIFHDLVGYVIEQQIHYRSKKKMYQKMLEKSEIEFLTLENFEHFEKSILSTARLSSRKFETIHELIIFFKQNKYDWNSLTDSGVHNKLISIKGIGNLGIEMILMYTLKRSNVFPYSDYHLKKIMQNVYNLDAKLKFNMLEIAEKWAPYKSLATRYLLAYKNQKH